jgi:hypothetical protein
MDGHLLNSAKSNVYEKARAKDEKKDVGAYRILNFPSFYPPD